MRGGTLLNVVAFKMHSKNKLITCYTPPLPCVRVWVSVCVCVRVCACGTCCWLSSRRTPLLCSSLCSSCKWSNCQIPGWCPPDCTSAKTVNSTRHKTTSSTHSLLTANGENRQELHLEGIQARQSVQGLLLGYSKHVISEEDWRGNERVTLETQHVQVPNNCASFQETLTEKSHDTNQQKFSDTCANWIYRRSEEGEWLQKITPSDDHKKGIKCSLDYKKMNKSFLTHTHTHTQDCICIP